MRLIDSHCHFDFPEFDVDRDKVLREAVDAGVYALVIPGVRAATWDSLLKLCHAQSRLFPALGLHPYFLEEHIVPQVDKLAELLQERPSEILAIGEIGVDARKPALDFQWELFRRQLDLAERAEKPVIIHSVKTHDEVYADLKRRTLRRGVIHAFSGSLQQAKHFVDLGFKLGVGGVITYPRARKTRDAIRRVPIDALVLESDAPDMAMAGHQGQRNSPQWLPDVLVALSELRQDSPVALAEQLWRNACELFGVDFATVAE